MDFLQGNGRGHLRSSTWSLMAPLITEEELVVLSVGRSKGASEIQVGSQSLLWLGPAPSWFHQVPFVSRSAQS